MKRKKCKREGCNNPVWSGGLCQDHIGKKPMKKSSNFIRKKKSRASVKQNQDNIKIMHEFFQRIWNKRMHRSEVSGEYLGKEPLTIYFHHIIPKSKFPEGMYDEDNIILLTGDEHGNVESDMFIYDEVNKRRELLLKKYNLI